ncbi:hypothetical protein MFLO_07682 [Listeria floridensis FSL S10-1187]|uniref:Cell wall-associated protease n=1 Tax=Listeria floridensis FSL S10-1187 TaxID=1265817 RepID=A0ABN0RFE7_9LIST|nr:Ig-like domain-containing protein [Listeria floridensis]EUJ32050.1 hypothetical protein MFLO_07682 [Listeria floridensis FSL S10-1187]
MGRKQKRLASKILKIAAAAAIFSSTVTGTFLGKNVVPDKESEAASYIVPQGAMTQAQANMFQSAQSDAYSQYNSSLKTLDYTATKSIARFNIGFPRTTTNIQVGKKYRVMYVVDANVSANYGVQWMPMPGGSSASGFYFNNLAGQAQTQPALTLNEYNPSKWSATDIVSLNTNNIMKFDVKVNNLVEGINPHGYIIAFKKVEGTAIPSWSVRLKAAYIFELDNNGAVVLPDPTINKIRDTDTVATGTAMAGSTVYIYNSQQQQIGSGTADANGNYSIGIPRQPAGSVVYADYVISVPNDSTYHSKRVNTVVVDETPPNAPTINAVWDTDTIVTGTAEANSYVELKVNGSVIGSGYANSSGSYSITVPRQTMGTVISATSRDAAGNVSQPASTVVQGAAIKTPTINQPVSDQDTIVTGVADPYATVTLTINGAQYVGTANSSGNYSITIPKQVAGTVITAQATLNGKTSGTSSAVVVDKTAPNAPTINSVTDQDTIVTGTAEPNSTVILKVNGVEIGRGPANSSGNYSITIPKQVAGTQITATATDAAGNVSGPASTIVTGTALGTPTINTVTDQDTIVTGKTEPNASVTLRIPSTGATYTGTADSNGNYSIIIPKQVAGTVIEVYAQKDGKTSPTANTTVVGTALPTPTINTVTDQDTLVTGKTEPNASVTLRIPQTDGSTLTWTGTADSNGNYAISISKQKEGTVIEVYAQKDGKTSPTANTTVIGTTLPTPTINQVTDQDTVVTGKTEPNANVTLRIPQAGGGYLNYTGTADSNGNYSITIPKQKEGQIIEVSAAKDGKTSPTANTTVIGTALPTPTINSVTDQDTVVTGKTEPNASVTLRIPQTGGGYLTFNGTADSNGNYSITIPKQAEGTVIEVYAQKDGKTSPTANTTVIGTTLPTPTINQVTDQDTLVTGKTEPNASVTLRIPQTSGGYLTYTGTADASGNYAIAIPKQKEGQIIEVSAAKDGKTSPTANTTVIGTALPTPTINQVTDQDTVVTGKTEPNANVTLRIPQTGGGYLTFDGTADSNGNYSITIPKQVAGTVIEVSAAKDGKTSPTANTTVIRTALDAPTINRVTDQDTVVTGKTEPNATVTLRIPQAGGGYLTYTGTADSSGNYSITIPKQAAGTVIQASAALNGLTSPNASTTVVDVTPPDAPTINPITDQDTTISGQAEPLSTVTIYANGVRVGQTTAGSNGSYSMTIPKQVEGTIMSATATDAAGNTSERGFATVTGTALPTPTINEVTDQDTVVTGKTEPGATVIITIPQAGGGSLVYSGVADANGNYSIPIAKQPAGTVIQAQATLGNKTSGTAQTTVVDKTAPTITLGAINDDQTSVTGQTEAGAIVKIYANGNQIAQGTAGANGAYTITIPKQTAGTTVTATATDAAGNVSSPAMQVVTSNPLAPPTINTVMDTDNKVTGTAVPNATVTLRIPQADGSALVYTGTADSSGNYSITISPQKAGTTIEATASLNGKTSTSVSTIVQASPVKDYSLTVPASYTIGTSSIAGTYGKDVAYVRLSVNGTVVSQATLDGNGNYVFNNISSFITKNSDVVEVLALDSSFVEQNRKSIPVTGEVVKDYSLTAPASYTIGNGTISGTYGKDISKVRLWVNGTVVAQATTDGNGNYTFNNVNNFVTKTTDVVQVVGVDSQYVERNRLTVPVVGQDLKDYSLTAPANYTIGGKTISGTYGKDISKVRLWVNGAVVAQATTDGNGNYTFNNVDSFITKKSDVVEVVGVDSQYVERNRKPVTVIGTDVMDYSLTVNQNPYVIGTSTALTGTYGKDLSKVRLFVNGAVVAQATTDSNGNYTFPNAAQFITSSTDTVKVVGVDSQYIQRAEKPVTVQGGINYDYSLTADPYKLNQANLTGTYGKDIYKVRLVVNGTIVRQAETDGNGNYTFPNVASFIQPGDTVEVVGVDSRYAEKARIPVNVEDDLDYKLTVNQNPYIIGTSTALTGTYGKDLSRVRLFVNGTVVAQAQTDGAGNYTFPNAAQYITSSSDVVKVVGVDSTFAQRAEAPVNVQGAINYDYSLTADRYELNQADLTGTYGKDIYKVRLVVNGAIVRQAETDGNGNYKFPNVASYIQPGDKVEVVGVDSRYQEQARIPVTVEDNRDYSLTVNQNPYLIGTSTALTGTYGDDISRVRLIVNGETVAQAQTDGAGNYTFPNAANFIKSNTDVVKVVGVDSAFAQQAEVPVNVQGSINYDYSLTADPYKLNQANLTGNYGKDIAYVRLVVNDQIVRQAELDGNGNYTFPNVASYIKAGDKVEVVGIDSSFAEKARIPVNVNENLDYSLTATPNPYTIGTSTTISGKYGEDLTQVRLVVNGTVVTQAQLDGNGNYTIPNAAQYIKADTDKVEVVGVDNQFVQQASQTITIQRPYDYSLTADSYRLNQADLTGTYGADIARVRIFINGVVVTQAQLDGNGNYTFPNIGSRIKAGDLVEIVGVDDKFAEKARIQVTVDEQLDYALTVNENPYTIGSSTSLSGTYGDDITRVRLEVNGVAVTQAQLDGNGNYSIPNAAQYIKADTDVVRVVGVDQQSAEQASVTVNVVSIPKDYSLTAPASYELGTKTITGTYGADIAGVRLVVNGEEKAQAQLNNGTYTFPNADTYITSGSDIVKVVGVDSSAQEQASKNVTVIVPKDYSLTVDEYKIGQDALTGTYGKDITAVRLYKDGALVVNRNVDGTGKYTFPEAYAQIKDDGALYEVIGVDSTNTIQVRKTVTPNGSLDFASTANPYTFGDSTITGTYGSDVARIQLVVNGTVKRLATLSGGTFSASAAGILSTDKVQLYIQDSHFITRQTIDIQN